MEIKIRKLTVKDRKAVSAMIKKLVDRLGSDELLHIISPDASGDQAGDGKPASIAAVGIEIIKLLIEFFDTDISSWFSSLIGVDAEHYEDLPLDTEIVILKQLQEAPEVENFFSGASEIFSAMKGFREKLTEKKGQ